MKGLIIPMLLLAGCSIHSENSLIQAHRETAHIHLIKLPPESRNDDWFYGGQLEIRKPKKGLVILQFEISGTVNTVAILAHGDSGEFNSLQECTTVKEVNFNTRSGSSIDVTDLSGKFLITYGSCNKAGTYILNLK